MAPFRARYMELLFPVDCHSSYWWLPPRGSYWWQPSGCLNVELQRTQCRTSQSYQCVLLFKATTYCIYTCVFYLVILFLASRIFKASLWPSPLCLPSLGHGLAAGALASVPAAAGHRGVRGRTLGTWSGHSSLLGGRTSQEVTAPGQWAIRILKGCSSKKVRKT